MVMIANSAVSALALASVFVQPIQSKQSNRLADVAWPIIDSFESACDPSYERRSTPMTTRKKIPELSEPLVIIDATRLPFSCGMSGSAGSPIVILGKINGQWTIVFKFGSPRSYVFLSEKLPTTLKLILHGSYCGKAGFENCERYFTFNGSDFR